MMNVGSVPKILVVDDMESNQIALSIALSKVNAEVITAGSGNEALALCTKYEFALVLLDVNMPIMDGYEVAHLLRQRDETRRMPILFITGQETDTDQLMRGYATGAVDYILKPVNSQILVSKASLFIELHNQRKELEARNTTLKQEIVRREQAEESNERFLQSREIISELLRLALEPFSLTQLLDAALDIILAVPWLSTDGQGCIFLMDPKSDGLEMVAQRNLSPELLKICHKTPLGYCHCGKAAQSQKIVVSDDVDARHDVRFEGMSKHGHYCVPVMHGSRLHGVINLYRKADCQSSPFEEKFLLTVAETLASTIEHKLINEELEVARHHAEESSQSKSEFLANMSHEIRTPMNAIIGLTDLALQETLPPRIKDYLSKVSNASLVLLNLINDILDFSKIEAGKLDLQPVDFLIRDVFDHLSDLFRAQADKHGIELIMAISLECQYVLIGDSLRLEQILMNLISNALKFTEEGEVLVGVEAIDVQIDQVMLKFSVKDSGIGMTEKQLSNLFIPFVQGDGSLNRKFGGTGLGLSICKRLTKLMGGDISASSEPGIGSLFEFTSTFGRRPEVEFGDDLLPPDDLQCHRALVVDDSPAVCKTLEAMLHLFTFDATSVSSGAAAEIEIQRGIEMRKPYQLLLVEWMMPRVDGIETIARISRSMAHTHEELIPKSILLTNFSREKLAREHVDKGNVDAFLAKPINCSMLFDTIMEIFGKDVTKVYRSTRKIVDPSLIRNQIQGARVLLAEDNVINQQVAKEILEGVGLLVDVAANGLEAVKKVMETSFDAVLMDIQMPQMDGYVATQRIRQDSRFAQLPIIAMTANAMAGDREKSLDVGMNDHVTKPIDRQQLYSVLIKWIARRNLCSVAMCSPGEVNKQENSLNKPETLPGIDLDLALDRLNGNEKLFYSLLRQFARDFADCSQQIRSGLSVETEESIHSARTIVHTVRGTAGNLGASGLFNSAMMLENGIKEGNKQDWSNLLNAFEQQVNQVFSSIATLPENLAGGAVEHGPVDWVGVRTALKELAVLVDDRDSKSLKQITKVKQLLMGTDVSDKVDELENCLASINFKGARIVLDAMTDVLGKSLEGDA